MCTKFWKRCRRLLNLFPKFIDDYHVNKLLSIKKILPLREQEANVFVLAVQRFAFDLIIIVWMPVVRISRKKRNKLIWVGYSHEKAAERPSATPLCLPAVLRAVEDSSENSLPASCSRARGSRTRLRVRCWRTLELCILRFSYKESLCIIIIDGRRPHFFLFFFSFRFFPNPSKSVSSSNQASVTRSCIVSNISFLISLIGSNGNRTNVD